MSPFSPYKFGIRIRNSTVLHVESFKLTSRTEVFLSESCHSSSPLTIGRKTLSVSNTAARSQLPTQKPSPSALESTVSADSKLRFILNRMFRKIVLPDDRSAQGSQNFIPVLLLVFSVLLLVIKTNSSPYFAIIQQVVFITGMLAIGLPHGAVDYLLEKGTLDSRLSFKFISNYLGLALLNYLLWLILPNIALLFFLAYSAWHFGETDMREWGGRIKSPIKNFSWGVLLLGIILLGHVTETNQILSQISGMSIPLTASDGKLFSWLLAAIAFLWGLSEKKINMTLSALMLFCSIFLPLLTAFGLYFIGQHSFNGWIHLNKGMKTNGFKLYLKALPFTLAAVVFFLLMYLIQNNFLFTIKSNWLAVFFVFISCISFPHVAAMNKFYRRYF